MLAQVFDRLPLHERGKFAVPCKVGSFEKPDYACEPPRFGFARLSPARRDARGCGGQSTRPGKPEPAPILIPAHVVLRGTFCGKISSAVKADHRITEMWWQCFDPSDGRCARSVISGLLSREVQLSPHIGGFAAQQEVVARRREEIDHLGIFGEPSFVLRTSRNDPQGYARTPASPWKTLASPWIEFSWNNPIISMHLSAGADRSTTIVA
jgi:hypothetical protein